MSRAGISPRTVAIITAAVAIAAVGWWLGMRATTPQADPAASDDDQAGPPGLRYIPAPRPRKSKSGRELHRKLPDLDALLAGALPGQRTLQFDDDAALRRFLDSLDGSGLRLLGMIPELRAVRLGFDDISAFDSLPDDLADSGFVFPVFIPNPPPADAQPGAVPLGAALAEWLGVGGDRSLWGSGVRVAVLDTGVAEHPVLAGTVNRSVLVALPDNPADQHGHGTAVASLIAGDHPLVPGVAPGSELISIRVADDSGTSDSFTLAQGVLAAVAAGAQVINISMGSNSHSSLLRHAITQAHDSGAVIVASSGNDGSQSIVYPAAYPEVIGVGAVDANGDYLEFSNAGDSLAATAPGFGVNAAWPGESMISFTGTSASAPVVAGAIAATMSQGTGTPITAQQAADAVLGNLNEAGYPGADPFYGAGTIDLGRVMRRDTPGVVDAALASTVLDFPPGGGQPDLLVTVENRGTEMLVNAPVIVTSGAGTTPLNITTLQPGATRTFTVPIPTAALDAGRAFQVNSSVRPGSGLTDDYPANDTRTDTISPTDG